MHFIYNNHPMCTQISCNFYRCLLAYLCFFTYHIPAFLSLCLRVSWTLTWQTWGKVERTSPASSSSTTLSPVSAVSSSSGWSSTIKTPKCPRADSKYLPFILLSILLYFIYCPCSVSKAFMQRIITYIVLCQTKQTDLITDFLCDVGVTTTKKVVISPVS